MNSRNVQSVDVSVVQKHCDDIYCKLYGLIYDIHTVKRKEMKEFILTNQTKW